jgi:hypothetical protein
MSPMSVCEDELGRVSDWRFEICSQIGFTPDDAYVLAKRHDIDLHDIIELVQMKGCPHREAVRILL